MKPVYPTGTEMELIAVFTAAMSPVNVWITDAVVLNRVTENHVGVPFSAPVNAVMALLIWASSLESMLEELSITNAMSRPQADDRAGFGAEYW